MKTQIEAISYGRFSSDAQAEGNSMTRQEQGYKDVLARYASRGLVESTRYGFGKIFLRGQSAFNSEGEHLDIILDLIRSGEIKPGKCALVIDEWSRFSRMVPDLAVGKLSEIVRAGVPVIIASPDMWVDVADLGSQNFILIAFFIQNAHQESKNKSRHQKAVREHIRETGLTKKNRRLKACPFWLTVGDDGQYHVIEEQAELVRRAMRLALTHGCQEIFRLLGNPTRSVKRRGKMIEANLDILGVLRNRAIIGEFIPTLRVGKSARKELAPKPGYYPNIDTDGIFNRVQTALDSRKTMRGRKGKFITNLFTELCHGSDGLTMYVKAEGRGRVLKRRSVVGSGEYRTWSYPAIETALLRFLGELKLTETYNSPVDGLTAELAQVEKKLGIIKGRMASDDNLDELLDTVSRLSGRKKELVRLIESEKGRVPETASLRQTQEILLALEKATGDDLLQLRSKLKAAIRRLVARVDCTFLQRAGGKVCTLVVSLTNGEVRNIVLTESKRKKVGYAHVCDGAGTTEVWTVRA
jgi:DNA invertase Pin-like site-specific DNA recombinase